MTLGVSKIPYGSTVIPVQLNPYGFGFDFSFTAVFTATETMT